MTSCDRNFLAIVLGRPAEQAEIIHHRFRRVTFVHVGRERGALVALAHLGAVDVQDERDVRILRRLDAERAKERDVLGGVAQVVLAANDVRDAHLQIVHHVDEMEHGLAVGADDDEIRIELLAVGQLARDIADDEIGNEDRVRASS